MRLPTWLVVLAVSLGLTQTARAADPVYFPVPGGNGVGGGISTAPNGDVWFASGTYSPTVTAIGRLRPADAHAGTTDGFGLFPTPVPANANCCANAVRSVAFDAIKDRIWFVQNDGVVGLGDPATMVAGSSAGMTATRLPGLQDLWDVAVAKNGDAAWITEHSASNVGPTYYGDRIAFVTSGLGVSEYDNLAIQTEGSTTLESLRYDAKPSGITTDANGAPWFAEADPGNPGYRIAKGLPGMGHNGTAGGYEEYLVQPCGSGNPCSGSYTGTGVTDVAVAADGAKWFTNQLKNEVGRLDGTTFTNYSLPAIDASLSGGRVFAITAAPDGSLLVVENGGYSAQSANAIIRIVPGSGGAAPTATVYKLPGYAPLAVTADGSGDVWFTASALSTNTAVIGKLPAVTGPGGGDPTPTATTTVTPTTTTTPQGTPTPTPPTPTPTPVVLKPTSVAAARVDPPHVKGPDVLADQICAARNGAGDCTVVYIISAGEYVTAFPGAKVRAGVSRKAKPVVLARKSVTLKPGQKRRVRVKLGRKGKKLLKRKHKLKVFFTATQPAQGGQPPKILRRTKLTLKR